MSLMLNALKRIEAKQAVEPARPIGEANLDAIANLIESALVADSPAPSDASLAPEVPLPISVMDQLHAYVAEAGLLYEMPPKFEEAEVVEAAKEFSAPLLDPVALPLVAVAQSIAVQSEPAIKGKPPIAALREATPYVSPPATDPYAEAAERIVSQLPTDRPQAILFTSAGSGHGTTSTLARLAPMLAEKVGGEVLVVDANDRNPNAARWLKASPQRRLDAIHAPTRWKDAVLATSHARVSLLPGNTACLGLNTSDSSNRMQSVLRELAGQYALVLVDAASLTERGTSELAAACDGAYLIVRLGEKSPRILREAVRVVANSGGRLLGCVAVDGEG